MLTGIDVSWHQGVVDWGAVRRAGHTFAFCKATDGVLYSHVDYYQAQAPRIRSVGLVPGAYHWLQAGPDGALRDPRGQARYFRQIVGNPAGLLCALDVESQRNQNGTLISAPRIDSVRAFADEWAKLTGGHTLIVYTGRWYWRDMIGNPKGVDVGPLWHSEYETSAAEVADGPEQDAYGGWARCTLWQYTSSGSVPGVSGNCDVNQFRGGDRAALLALTGTPQEEEMTEDDWNRMLALVKGASEVAVQDVLDRNARLVFGITNTEAYLEALLAAARKGAALDVPTAAEVADAVVAKLPAGTTSLSRDDVKALVQEVFAEVRYTTAPTDVAP